MKDADELNLDREDDNFKPQTVQDMLKVVDGLAEKMGITSEKFGIFSALSENAMPKWALDPDVFAVREPVVPHIPPSPMIAHGARTARNTEEMRQLMELLVNASRLSLEQSVKTENFSRRMSFASLWISIGSLAAAVGSIVVAIIALAP